MLLTPLFGISTDIFHPDFSKGLLAISITKEVTRNWMNRQMQVWGYLLTPFLVISKSPLPQIIQKFHMFEGNENW